MAHDVIVMVNGSNDASPEAIRAIVRAAAPGDTITVTVVRAGQLRDAFVTLAAWEPKHMVRAVGEMNEVAPAMASGEPARAPAPLPVAAVQPAPAPKAEPAPAPVAVAQPAPEPKPEPAPEPKPAPAPAPVAQQAPAAAPSDPAMQDELAKARARIAELERRVQADEAVRKAIRPQPAPQPNATPGPARTPPAP
jgi:hypothetical protein